LVFALLGWYWRRFQGAVDGINLAIPYYIIYTQASIQHLTLISAHIQPSTLFSPIQVLMNYGNPMLVDHLKPELRYPSPEAMMDDETVLIRFGHQQQQSKTK